MHGPFPCFQSQQQHTFLLSDLSPLTIPSSHTLPLLLYMLNLGCLWVCCMKNFPGVWISSFRREDPLATGQTVHTMSHFLYLQNSNNNGEKWQLLSHVWLSVISWTVAHQALCPWDYPDKHTGVGCHFLLQGIFPTQGSNLRLSHCRCVLYLLSQQGSSIIMAPTS